MVEPDPSTHVVVFDVNVWLDVARLFGPGGFSWGALTSLIAGQSHRPCPADDNRQLDSARALATCTTGRFAGTRALQVWTSAHLDNVLMHKLMQPVGARVTEDRGLGWSPDDADDFLQDCVYDLVYDLTGGGTVGEILIPHSNPPLDHEDGCVYRSSLEAGDDPVVRFLVTSDRDFRTADLAGDVTKLYPYEWVLLARRSRAAVGMSRMRPPV